MSFLSCPNELVFLICQLACNDGGKTFSDLSQVSKYFHNITLPLRFTSISLSSPTQFTRLNRELPLLPPIHNVRHLFISETAKDPSDYISLLQLTSCTLETLSLYMSNGPTSTSLIASVYRVSFPNLRDLMISGFYSYPLAAEMPKLRRVHFVGNRNPLGLLDIGFDVLFPSLTHLRISGVSSAPAFAEELQMVLESDPAVLPPTLRRVIVQLGPVVPRAEIADKKMVKVFRELVTSCDDNSHTKFTLREDRMKERAFSKEKTREMWVESILGREGWWTR
ncbi:uncharacterized protein BT62DRAFT_262467 [Guyanagaster necrorhizus]|uniref:Uncharacterized protein n=1 Tax=Guyanagaster necrorhizus TaxID=856835 RepID=A0A9P8AXF2_9AGAR|nr:uncharacterized protein BT62DRAFT_262467 [Guyanagaster necrorhizus MCA 3950]KAG7451714.1 hypothetical protein BT62DRAFT_262467 [Guyanagaster necrorhizus MCA 3950]